MATGSAEHDTSHQGNLKFFSRETNTIFPPKLEVEWDDSSWNTGSLSALSATDLDRLKIYFQNLKPEYKEKSKVKFRVVGRELYPTRGFDTTPAALTVKYLPSGSRTLQQGAYYSVKDAETEDVNLLITGEHSTTVGKYVMAGAKERKDAMAFISPSETVAVNSLSLIHI